MKELIETLKAIRDSGIVPAEQIDQALEILENPPTLRLNRLVERIRILKEIKERFESLENGILYAITCIEREASEIAEAVRRQEDWLKEASENQQDGP